MKTILAVDAGGTKPHAALLDAQNHILAESFAGAGNPTVDYENALAHIEAVIEPCLSETMPCANVVGAAGAGAYADAVQTALQNRFSLPVFVTTDGILSIYAALGERDGVLVISGTGSLIQGKKNGILFREGGWGHLLGEYGSGASIGYHLLTVLTESIDMEKPIPTLQNAVFETFGVADRWEMTAYVYSHSKGDIAALAPLLIPLPPNWERFMPKPYS